MTPTAWFLLLLGVALVSGLGYLVRPRPSGKRWPDHTPRPAKLTLPRTLLVDDARKVLRFQPKGEGK